MTGNDRVGGYTADLASLKQIRLLADQIRKDHDRIDVLINNAGVNQPQREISPDGFEMTLAVNYLALFALSLLLLDLLKKAAPSRMVNVSSMVHSDTVDFDNLQGEKTYGPRQAYGLSKLCVIVFTYQLAERLRGSGVTVNCLHPGVIETKLLRRAGFSGGAPVENGAGNLIYLANSSELEGLTGKYFMEQHEAKSSPGSYDETVWKKLWRKSEEMTGVQLR
jgi:NAD(P)-dependent dehydrogenase (short-subunit alcohol dehydrogenase family)